MFDRQIESPDWVPRMLAQLMARETVEIGEDGIAIEWDAVDRHIDVDNHKLTFQPPAKCVWTGVVGTIRTTLRGIEISENGRQIRILLFGPDITIHLTEPNRDA